MYEEKTTQKQRLLNVLKLGAKVCQIDLNYYLALREFKTEIPQSPYIDAIALLGIANLPARIYGLKQDGYKIKTEKVNVKGRFCKTYYYVYSLEKEER